VIVPLLVRVPPFRYFTAAVEKDPVPDTIKLPEEFSAPPLKSKLLATVSVPVLFRLEFNSVKSLMFNPLCDQFAVAVFKVVTNVGSYVTPVTIVDVEPEKVTVAGPPTAFKDDPELKV